MDEDIRTEQKTWQVYNFEKINVFRLDIAARFELCIVFSFVWSECLCVRVRLSVCVCVWMRLQ